MSVSPNKSQPRIKVLYDFKYTTREGQDVTITKDEELLLLKKTNTDWWHAQRSSENEAFYVPATYVEEMLENNECQESTSTSAVTPIIQRRGLAVQSNETDVHDASATKEEKKNHDSFRNVIRKLSGNLNSSSTKPGKTVKLTKKNSMNSHDEKSSKVKSENLTEASAFAKCFGRDMKNENSRPQNRFQEELETALVNRGQRNIVYSSKMDDHLEQKTSTFTSEKQLSRPIKSISPSDKAASQQKLEKLTQKLQDNKTKTIENLTKEFESRVQKCPKSSTDNATSTNEISSQTNAKKVINEARKEKLKLDLPTQEQAQGQTREQKQETLEHKVEQTKQDQPKEENKNVQTEEKVLKRRTFKSIVSEMDDEAILKDNRKMWAIERLMSELLQSSEKTTLLPKLTEESNEESRVCVSKKSSQVSANEQTKSKEEKVIFDFSVSPSSVAPKTVTKKSPKVLDEYNEANILNDNDKSNYEKPSYCSVSLKSRKKSTPNLRVKLKSLESDLQLTPSLEKLASEIQFIPANHVAEQLKQCSKSDSALNEFSRPKVSHAFGSLGHKNYEHTKKPKPRRLHIFGRKFSFAGKKDAEKQQLKRKTRSLDDLNLVEEDVHSLGVNINVDGKSKVEKKPVALFKSTDSLKKSAARPIPAKRKVFDVFDSRGNVNTKPLSSFIGSCENVPIDLERSTAVGFKTLLRTSDSGSEEFLQNKAIPNTVSKLKFANSNDVSSQRSGEFNPNDIGKKIVGKVLPSGIKGLESNANTNCGNAENIDNFVQLPDGWKQEIDLKTRQLCYVNEYGDKWFSSNDSEGKIYFFEENSNKSSWALPAVKDRNVSRCDSIDNLKIHDFKTKMKMDDSPEINDLKFSNWPQLFHGNMCILKEGFLNRTKITEHGKKLKKCWNSSYAVLTELFLLFFRDEKVFSAMKMGHLSTAKPDISVDLNGASIESGDKFSSRKNVFLISTIFGLQVLIQSDNSVQSIEWYQEIKEAAKALPSGRDHRKCMYNEE